MLISLHELVEKYKIQFKGILHVGAHECEELNDYEKYLSNDKILWIEAMKDKVEICKTRFPGIKIEQAVISDKIEKVIFNISNNGQSSSILDFGLHSHFHPHVVFVNSVEMETKVLKDIICNYDIDYNFINLDIQGVELRALKSMEEYLHKIDYIYTEVNSDYVYKDCTLVTELDDYLSQFDFTRVETSWCCDYRCGDAFYIKNKKI
jgi:FkbM family methyltransferase